MKYLLAPPAIVNGIAGAEARIPEGEVAWAVAIQFDAEATDTFKQITTELAGTGRQYAMVVDGNVVSAPTVEAVIEDGASVISGNFDEESATALAVALEATS